MKEKCADQQDQRRHERQSALPLDLARKIQQPGNLRRKDDDECRGERADEQRVLPAKNSHKRILGSIQYLLAGSQRIPKIREQFWLLASGHWLLLATGYWVLATDKVISLCSHESTSHFCSDLQDWRWQQPSWSPRPSLCAPASARLH